MEEPDEQMKRRMFDAVTLQRIDPKREAKRREKLETTKLWFIFVLLAAIGAFIFTLVLNSSKVFFPAWFGLTVILWTLSEGMSNDNRD